jgi:DNA polymerase III subunit gamma/tau
MQSAWLRALEAFSDPSSYAIFSPMPYEITATRKRPQNFEEFKGQEFVSATLEASLASGRIAHAYLFSGPRGCGKTSAARILAKALNCERGPTAQPCGVCRSCQEIARGSSLDVIEIDGASNTSVDNVRQIKDEVLFPPNGGRYKVYIIDEVHMLSNSAFNALLKTIEEPPPYIVFIFATTELHKVPATIKSRCQQFAFRLFKAELVQELLASAAADLGVEAEDEALLWIAKESGGSLRDAYTLFDQVVAFSEGKMTAELIRDKLGLTGLDSLNGLFRAGAMGDTKAALEALDEILSRGVSPEQLASEAADYCRSLLLIKAGIDKASLLGAPVSAYDERALEAFDSERLERALAGLLDLYRNMRFTVDPRFELELAVAKLCRLGDYVSPTELAKAVAALKRFVAGDASAAPAGGEKKKVEPTSALKPENGPRPSEEPKPQAEHRLPPQLSAAFDSLAATAASAAIEADAASAASAASAATKAAQEQPKAAAGAATRPSPPPRVMKDSSEGSEGEDDDEASLDAAYEAPATAPSVEASDGIRGAVIDAVGRSSPLLKTGLASSLPWRIEATRLVIPFRSGMEESVVRGSIAEIAAKASELAGRSLKVELKVELAPRSGDSVPSSAPGPSAPGPDPVAIVERVFRGTRLPDSVRGDN